MKKYDNDFISNISSISLGTWAIGGKGWGEVSDEESIKIIKKAVDIGINSIDTAPIYGFGHSEEVVGKAIKGIRDKVVLTTKCGLIWDNENNVKIDNSNKVIKQEIERSLKRLDTDYIDIYLIHWPEGKTPLGETFESLKEIKDSGKVKFLGVCNFHLDLLEEAKKYIELDVIQMGYNMLQRDIEKNIIPYCEGEKIPIMAYSPLAQGLLTGKFNKNLKLDDDDVRNDNRLFQREYYPLSLDFIENLKRISEEYQKTLIQLALTWVLVKEPVVTSICGVKNLKQLEGIKKSLNSTFPQEAMAFVDEVYNKLFGKV